MGFDIATGMFGDPKLGALGHTATGPGSDKLRDSGKVVGLVTRDAPITSPVSRQGGRLVLGKRVGELAHPRAEGRLRV